MSPMNTIETAEQLGFPRVSGDEPTCQLKLRVRVAFSPRERG